MRNEVSNEIKENLKKTSDLAKILNTSPKVIIENAKKFLPNKVFKNGKTTYYTEEEATILIEGLKGNNPNQSTFTGSVKAVSTTLKDNKPAEVVGTAVLAEMDLVEVSRVLNYDLDYLRKKCKELGFTKNGIKTTLNEKQVDELRKILVPRTLDMKVQGQNIKTSISIKENFLKATQDYIALIESEKKQLEDKNQQLEKQVQEQQKVIETYKVENDFIKTKQEIITEQMRKKNKTKAQWACTEKAMRQIGFSRYAGCYLQAHRYFYRQFKLMHPNIEQKIEKRFFLKNPHYIKELADIIISEDITTKQCFYVKKDDEKL